MFLRKVSQDLAEAFQWAAVPSARSSPLSASCWHVPSKEKSKCKSVGGGKKKKYLKHGARVDLPQMFPSGRMPWWAAHCPGHFEGQEGARAGCLPSPPHGPPTMAAHHHPLSPPHGSPAMAAHHHPYLSAALASGPPFCQGREPSLAGQDICMASIFHTLIIF